MYLSVNIYIFTLLNKKLILPATNTKHGSKKINRFAKTTLRRRRK